MVDVVRDDAPPTGVMAIHVDDSERVFTYYRSNSAARLLSTGDLERLGRAAWTHATGMAPVLEPFGTTDCRAEAWSAHGLTDGLRVRPRRATLCRWEPDLLTPSARDAR